MSFSTVAVFSHAKFQGVFFRIQQIPGDNFTVPSGVVKSLGRSPKFEEEVQMDFGWGMSNTLKGNLAYPGNGTDGTGVFYLHLGPKLPKCI